MKPTALISALLIAMVMGLASCSDDFLNVEDKDTWYSTDTLELSGHLSDVTVRLTIKEAKNKSYTVMIYPKWINLEAKSGNFIHGETTITLGTTNEDLFPLGPYIGMLVFEVDKLGYVQVMTRYRHE